METITACENICRDFSWVGPVTEWLRNLAIVLGVFFGWRQLEAWRHEARARKKSEIAEELVGLAYIADDAFRDIRNRFSSVPKDKAQDKTYGLQQRYDRIIKYNELFQKIRSAQIKCRTVIGDDKTDAAVEELFKFRSEIAVAIEILTDYVDDDDRSPEARKHKLQLRKTMLGSFDDKDELGNRFKVARDVIVKQLSPIARFE